MKTVTSAGAMLMALLVGCRSHSAQELLERDLRRQEDVIYSLQGQVDQQCAMVQALEQENAALRSSTAAVTAPSTPSTLTTPRGAPRSNSNTIPGTTIPLAPPSIELPTEQAPPFRAPPEIQPFDPSIPEGVLPKQTSAPLQPAPLHSAALQVLPSEGELKLDAPDNAPAEVTTIVLNPRITGGYAADDKPGDDGVTVFVEPRAADGKPVERPGQITIVVLDPAIDGPKSRIARWDFVETDVASRWRATPDGKGWRFDLHWPSGPPTHNALTVHTRYTTPSGGKLDAQAQIAIQLASTAPTVERTPFTPRSQQWTRSSRPLQQLLSPQMPTRPMPQAMPINPPDDAANTAARGWSPYR